jgi:light-regulated signal transduction histidine kinase (bacteriophytochrome)
MDTAPAKINDVAITDCAAQLQQAQQELQSLTYAISHDLRAPVRAIAGFSQALKEHSVDTLDATAQHFLARVEESTQRLSAMIDGLLALSRLSQAEMQFITVDIGALCASINAELAAQFPQHHPRVRINAAVNLACDPHLLRIALHALLHNAWKFTQGCSDAQIDINTDVQGDALILRVRDNGVGFDARYIDKLFVPFQHLQARSEQHGLGIGLASAQRIIARHGGTLHAEALARGTEFSVAFRNTDTAVHQT